MAMPAKRRHVIYTSRWLQSRKMPQIFKVIRINKKLELPGDSRFIDSYNC